MTNYRCRRRTIRPKPDGRSRDKRQSLLGAGVERWSWTRRRRPYQDESDAACRRLICYALLPHRLWPRRPHREHQARRFRSLSLICGFYVVLYYLVTFYCPFYLDILVLILLSATSCLPPTSNLLEFHGTVAWLQKLWAKLNIKHTIIQAYKYKYNYAVYKSKSTDWNSQWILWLK